MLDRSRFEACKTKYCELEGWDPRSGRPRRNTSEVMGLSEVADELQDKDRLG
jgi:aldehyde:ferredoxin oxidoreductase